MTELEDLRGRTLFWIVRRERPLWCVLSEGSSIIGSIESVNPSGTLVANLAGILWKMSASGGLLRKTDEYGFADGSLIVAVGGLFPSGYVLDVEEGCRYDLVREEHRAEWRNGAGRAPVSFLESGLSRGSAGEAIVASTAELIHAPILVFAGIVRAVGGRMFVPQGENVFGR